MADNPSDNTPTADQAALLAEQEAKIKAKYGKEPNKRKPKGPQRTYWDSADYQLKKAKEGGAENPPQ